MKEEDERCIKISQGGDVTWPTTFCEDFNFTIEFGTVYGNQAKITTTEFNVKSTNFELDNPYDSGPYFIGLLPPLAVTIDENKPGK